MSQRINKFGQPIGPAVPHWQAAQYPETESMNGSFCNLQPLKHDLHARQLFEAFQHDKEGKLWTYMASGGPFSTFTEFSDWVKEATNRPNQLYYAIIDGCTDKATGFASYMRIQETVGVVEVGSIAYSPLLQRTPAATEAMFLMMRHAFEIFGYRRYEWKCDSLNAPSNKAAERYGFKYEGTFRQAMVYRGRNRDTAWFSILDHEWPVLKQAYQRWLSPNNFDAAGIQKEKLKNLITRLKKEEENKKPSSP